MTPQQLLTYERQHPGNTPTKRANIRHHLGITDIRYWQLLERAAHDADGMRAEPVMARIIRERVHARARVRALRIA